MAEAFSFAVDTSEFQKLAKTLKLTPKELQKPVARLLGDMAYDFKAQAPDVLEGVYTIRDKGFVKNKAFAVKRPKASDPIDSQEAVAASLRIESPGGLFTGWEEEIEGKPREMRSKNGRYHRTISPNAREGGSVYEKMLGKYRLRTESDRIPDSRQHPDLTIRQFIAMVSKSSAAGQSKRAKRFKGKDYALGKNKVFIMGGPETPLGLYALKDGKVKRMQAFHEQPVKSEVGKFDWRKETEELVRKKFTPEYIWQNYIAPAVMALFSKK